MSKPPRAKLIAIGNPFWRDDAAGLAVARRVRAAALDGVDVIELGGDPASLLETLDGADLAVIVDATRSGAAAGSVHRVEVSDGDQLPDRRRRDSSHGIALGDLVALARALDRIPGRLVLFGIEAAELGPGTGLSARVAEAVKVVTRQVLHEPAAAPAERPAQAAPSEPAVSAGR
jgi:hydrogenase maturation protease